MHRVLTSHRQLNAVHYSAPTPSFQPIGIIAAATSFTPLSVANKLNCAAAFLVSNTSTRMPSAAICRLVSGLRGMIEGPVPMIRRSGSVSIGHQIKSATMPGRQEEGRELVEEDTNVPGRGHKRSRTANELAGISSWPFLFASTFDPLASHGRQLNTSPSINMTPFPSVIVTPLFSPNPSYVHTSTDVEGIGVLARTSSSPKSVGGGCAGAPWLFL